MTLRFEPQGSAAIDRVHGIEIRQPRILQSDRPGEVEYQYSIIIKGESCGLGFHGTYEPTVVNGASGATSSLLLAPDDVLKHVLEMQAKIGDRSEPIPFLCDFSRGLLTVYESGIFNYENSHYLVLAAADGLTRLGIEVPSTLARTETGVIILAELFVPYAESGSPGTRS